MAKQFADVTPPKSETIHESGSGVAGKPGSSSTTTNPDVIPSIPDTLTKSLDFISATPNWISVLGQDLWKNFMTGVPRIVALTSENPAYVGNALAIGILKFISETMGSEFFSTDPEESDMIINKPGYDNILMMANYAIDLLSEQAKNDRESIRQIAYRQKYHLNPDLIDATWYDPDLWDQLWRYYTGWEIIPDDVAEIADKYTESLDVTTLFRDTFKHGMALAHNQVRIAHLAHFLITGVVLPGLETAQNILDNMHHAESIYEAYLKGGIDQDVVTQFAQEYALNWYESDKDRIHQEIADVLIQELKRKGVNATLDEITNGRYKPIYDKAILGQTVRGIFTAGLEPLVTEIIVTLVELSKLEGWGYKITFSGFDILGFDGDTLKVGLNMDSDLLTGLAIGLMKKKPKTGLITQAISTITQEGDSVRNISGDKLFHNVATTANEIDWSEFSIIQDLIDEMIEIAESTVKDAVSDPKQSDIQPADPTQPVGLSSTFSPRVSRRRPAVRRVPSLTTRMPARVQTAARTTITGMTGLKERMMRF